jgi:hypothetical protein
MYTISTTVRQGGILYCTVRKIGRQKCLNRISTVGRHRDIYAVSKIGRKRDVYTVSTTLRKRVVHMSVLWTGKSAGCSLSTIVRQKGVYTFSTTRRHRCAYTACIIGRQEGAGWEASLHAVIH